MTRPTITLGTAMDHTGIWFSSLKPVSNHSLRDDPVLAAKLWVRRAKHNPATIDTLKAADVVSCDEHDVPFVTAVIDLVCGSNGNTPPHTEHLETPADIPTRGLSQNPIPEQLRGCRFILVGAGSKRAIEPKWQTDRNYAYDDQRLIDHIAAGGNYGVMVSGGACVLDADDPQAIVETGALTSLLGTYTVRTGRDGGGAHLYFRCPELPAEKYTLTHPDTGASLGDLRGSDSPFYVVGPGSLHPDTGRPYEPVDPDSEILEIPLETVQGIISSLKKPEPEKPAERPKPSVRGRSISDELNLRPEHFLMPENARQRDGEIEGTHTIHGSSTGNNLTISPNGTWYCRRCQSGGGALEALAVADGIIDCASAQPGCLDGHWDAVMQALEKRGYGEQLRALKKKAVIETAKSTAPATTARLPPLDTLISVSKTGRVDLRYADIARYLIQIYHPVTLKRTLYIYLEETGIYVEDGGQIENAVQEIANLVNYDGRITTAKREVVSYVMDHNVVDAYPFDQHPDALPIANGVLEIDWTNGSVQLKPYHPKYLFKQKWPVVYDPTASPDRFHTNVLSRYVDDDAIDALYQMPAQAVLQYCGYGPFKRSYIAEGPPNGGKTTYLMGWLNALFGDENISGVSLQQISNDRFAKSDLNGAIINRYDDLSDILMNDVGAFKALTGGFYHTIEEKHKSRFPGRITAVHIYSTNSPPVVTDKVAYDPAFWVRWIYLRFNNVFEIDPEFVAREFTAEAISGSFNRVLEYVFRIRETRSLIYEQDPSEVKTTWNAATNPFEKFVADTMDDASAPVVFDKGVLFRSFLGWCGEHDISPRKVPGTITGFTQLIYGSGFTTTRRGPKHQQTWQYEARKKWKDGYEPDNAGGLKV